MSKPVGFYDLCILSFYCRLSSSLAFCRSNSCKRFASSFCIAFTSWEQRAKFFRTLSLKLWIYQGLPDASSYFLERVRFAELPPSTMILWSSLENSDSHPRFINVAHFMPLSSLSCDLVEHSVLDIMMSVLVQCYLCNYASLYFHRICSIMPMSCPQCSCTFSLKDTITLIDVKMQFWYQWISKYCLDLAHQYSNSNHVGVHKFHHVF